LSVFLAQLAVNRLIAYLCLIGVVVLGARRARASLSEPITACGEVDGVGRKTIDLGQQMISKPPTEVADIKVP
jgi:hypothetical protein